MSPTRCDPTKPDYCDSCNYDTHRCGGCGEPLPHGIYICDECQHELDAASPPERAQ